jgi:DNA/RNA endonuclease G (NUC1)
MKKIFFLGVLVFTLLFLTSINDTLKHNVHIKNDVFEVEYSQELEEPLWLIYYSTNRPTNVNRGSMNFYTEKNIKTSDNLDYKNNIYDKGHLAPAASFSDNMVNLKQTFSYLNCALQHQDLNRGEWRFLEEQERIWDNDENLMVKIELIFDENSETLTTGATAPSFFIKHIHFEKTKFWKCYKFPNSKPNKKWVLNEIKCNH